jgi:mono/diheme cytochrome c family protein
VSKSVCKHIRRYLLAGLAALLLPPSCNSGFSPPPVLPPPPTRSAETHASLIRGYSIHQAKCANCHAFENPSKYSKVELRDNILPRMSRMAKLTSEEQDAVLAYLISVSKR